MKLKILTILFLLSTNISLDYSPLTIKQLIGQAEIIAKCQIVSVDDKSFTVQFVDVIKGKAPKELKVNKFRNWTCAARVLEYKVGQIELMFLSKKENVWKALGAGNEGEVFIKNELVYYLHYIPIRKANDLFELEGTKLRGFVFAYNDVKNAIEYYIENSKNINSMTEDQVKNFKSENIFLQGIINSSPHLY